MRFFDPGQQRDQLQSGYNAGSLPPKLPDGSIIDPAAAEVAAAQGLQSPLSDEREDKPASLASLDKTERAGGGAAAGNLWNPSDGGQSGQQSLGKKITTGIEAGAELAEGKSSNKLFAGGFVGLAVAIIATVGFLGLIEKEVVHFADVLEAYEEKIVQHAEKDEGNWVFRKILQRARNKAEAEADAKANPDSPVTDEIDSMAVKLDEFAPELAAHGFKVTFDKAGDLTAFTDPAGVDLTKVAAIPDADFAEIDSQVIEQSQVGSLLGERPDLAIEYDAQLDPFPADTDVPADKFNQEISNDVVNGASAQQVASEEATVTEEQPPEGTNPTSTQTTTAQEIAEQTGPLGDALKAAESEMTKTGDATQALAAGEDAFDAASAGAKTGLATYVLDAACNVEQAAQKAADVRKVIIADRDIRQGALLLSIANQVRSGHITSGTMKNIITLFRGKQGAKNADGTPSQDALNFDQSATWTKATSTGPIADDNYANDIDPSALPTADSGVKIVDTIQGFMNKTGGALTCKALTSTWGTIIQSGIGAVQFFATIATLGAAQLAIMAGNVGFMLTLQQVIIPQIISYFTGFSVSGTQNAVGQANVGGLGMNMDASVVYDRGIGGLPQTPAQVQSLNVADTDNDIAEAKTQPWTYRTFALDNPYSLASDILDNVPMTWTDLLTNTSSFITNIPTTVLHTFSALVNPHEALAAANVINAPDGDGTTQYANVSGMFDPISNETYLRADNLAIPGGQTISRVAALGDPGSFQEGTSDGDYSDLLHCFIDNYDIMASTSAGNPADATCGSIGQLDVGSNVVLPSVLDIASIYCNYGGNSSPSCPAALAPQLDDSHGGYGELYRYAQYVTDTNVGAFFNYVPVPGVTNASSSSSSSSGKS